MASREVSNRVTVRQIALACFSLGPLARGNVQNGRDKPDDLSLGIPFGRVAHLHCTRAPSGIRQLQVVLTLLASQRCIHVGLCLLKGHFTQQIGRN